jgi:transposase
MLYQPGKAYSQDLRERVFVASDEGEQVGEIAELLRVSVSYVSKVLKRRRTTGETTVLSGAAASRRSWHPSTRRSERMLPSEPTRRSQPCGRGCWRRIRFQPASD